MTTELDKRPKSRQVLLRSWTVQRGIEWIQMGQSKPVLTVLYIKLYRAKRLHTGYRLYTFSVSTKLQPSRTEIRAKTVTETSGPYDGMKKPEERSRKLTSTIVDTPSLLTYTSHKNQSWPREGTEKREMGRTRTRPLYVSVIVHTHPHTVFCSEISLRLLSTAYRYSSWNLK